MEFGVERLFGLFLVVTIALTLVISYRLINEASAATLIIFTFLFASLIFQLEGSRSRKLVLLTIGNTIGLFWSFAFHYFGVVGTLAFGDGFKILNVVIFPFLNLMWIVPFWSLSVGLLPKMRNLDEARD